MFPSFNDIGEILAKKKPESYPLNAIDSNDVMIRTGIFKKTDNSYTFDRKGLEKAIAKIFSILSPLVHSGNVCSFGTVQRRNLFYSSNPNRNFYSLYGEDASLILGSNTAELPDGWKGRAVLLSALFTVENGEIAIVRSMLEQLLPRTGISHRHSATRKKPNARRTDYLEYFCEHISNLQEAAQKDASVKKRIRRPKPKEILAWLNRNKACSIKNDRTIRRDLDAFKRYDPKSDAFDKRDGLIAAIWKNIDNPKIVLHSKTLDSIIDEMAKIRRGVYAKPGIDLPMQKTCWKDDADATGHGSTRTIRVEGRIDIDKDLRTL